MLPHRPTKICTGSKLLSRTREKDKTARSFSFPHYSQHVHLESGVLVGHATTRSGEKRCLLRMISHWHGCGVDSDSRHGASRNRCIFFWQRRVEGEDKIHNNNPRTDIYSDRWQTDNPKKKTAPKLYITWKDARNLVCHHKLGAFGWSESLGYTQCQNIWMRSC